MDTVIDQDLLINLFKRLEEGTFFKLIVGASYTHLSTIRDFVTIYSLAGVDVIDLAADADVIASAQEGVNFAEKVYREDGKLFPAFRKPVIMVSINVGDEPHFRKAVLKSEQCTLCKHCIPVCSTNAFTIQNSKLSYNMDLCYGCGKCIPQCHEDALFTINRHVDYNMLWEIFDPLGVRALEIHTGTASIAEVENLCQMLPQNLLRYCLVSFSVESKRFNYKDLIVFTDNLTRILDKKVVIQIDGAPMSGNSSSKSSLNTISAAGILLENNINAYIQLSGGTNHLTKSLTEQFKLPINGIGMGTFARKIVQPFIDKLYDTDMLLQAVQVAKQLVNGQHDIRKEKVY